MSSKASIDLFAYNGSQLLLRTSSSPLPCTHRLHLGSHQREVQQRLRGCEHVRAEQLRLGKPDGHRFVLHYLRRGRRLVREPRYDRKHAAEGPVCLRKRRRAPLRRPVRPDHHARTASILREVCFYVSLDGKQETVLLSLVRNQTGSRCLVVPNVYTPHSAAAFRVIGWAQMLWSVDDRSRGCGLYRCRRQADISLSIRACFLSFLQWAAQLLGNNFLRPTRWRSHYLIPPLIMLLILHTLEFGVVSHV